MVGKKKTPEVPLSKNAKPRESKPQPETKDYSGVYELPDGGKLTINSKGITTYEGTPYSIVTLKKKYRSGTSDKTPDGKVKSSMKK